MTLTPMRAAIAAIAVVLVVGAFLALRPGGAGEPGGEVTITAHLGADRLIPERLEVERGQRVTLNLTSHREGVLHVHGGPQLALELEPADQVSTTFTAETSGVYAIEWHGSGENLEVGLLVVYEP